MQKSHDQRDPGVDVLAEALGRLPHRPPFLLIDRLLELEPRRRAVATKVVSHHDPFLAGHFPGMPIMPGVLIAEALAQTAACMMLGEAEPEGQLPLLAGIDGCRFRRVVRPGDELRLEVSLKRLRGKFGFVSGVATVAGVRVAEADILFTWLTPDAQA